MQYLCREFLEHNNCTNHLDTCVILVLSVVLGSLGTVATAVLDQVPSIFYHTKGTPYHLKIMCQNISDDEVKGREASLKILETIKCCEIRRLIDI